MSENVDVLAVMEEAAHALNSVDYRIERDELLGAIAAVGELIEAIHAERKGEYHDSEVEFRVNYDARRYQEKKRVEAALARVKGA